MQENTLLQAFTYGEKPVRTIILDDKPFFALVDVASVLEIRHPQNFLRSKRCDPDGVCQKHLIDSMGREQQATFIDEPNLYAIVLRSDKEEAIAFQRWITHEVLPAIRKTGSYQAAPALPQDYKSALRALLGEVEQRERLTAQVQVLTPKAEFADTVSRGINSHTVAEAAKVLGWGEIRLFNWLRQYGYLMTQGTDRNLPYQKWLEAGLFTVTELTYKHRKSGEDMLYSRTLITGKGLIRIHGELKSQGIIVPPLPHEQAS